MLLVVVHLLTPPIIGEVGLEPTMFTTWVTVLQTVAFTN